MTIQGRELALRLLEGVLILSFCFGFELFLLFSRFYRFSCLLLAFAGFLLLDDLLEPFLTFGLLAVLHGILNSNFKLYVFIIN
jgi:hypothetical protein